MAFRPTDRRLHGSPLILARPMHRRGGLSVVVCTARSAASICCVAAATMMGGCLDMEHRAAIAESGSVLAPMFKQPSPTDAAMWASDQFDADKRARGTALLANAPFGGEEPYLALYREYVNDPFVNVRAVAARGLGRHGTPEDVKLLIPLLADKEASVRLETAWALQRLHNPIAIEPLVNRLDAANEFEPAIRAAAATALGQYATNRSLQGLIQALADDQLVVTQSAFESLQTLTGNDDLPDEQRDWALWAKETDAPFANQRDFAFPVFQRERRWIDWVPFMPPVPNEPQGRPAGMPQIAAAQGRE